MEAHNVRTLGAKSQFFVQVGIEKTNILHNILHTSHFKQGRNMTL